MAEVEATRRGGSIRELRKRRLFAVLPSLLTLGNAVCGFGAITYAAKLGPEFASKEDLYTAALLIFGAMVCDALDGPLARFSRQTSDFGAQLDSLCDAISFGVAPAFLMLKLSFDHVFHPRILWVIAVLYMLCAILRLARFNVSKQSNPDHEHFSGLPSPAAAGMVASLVVIAPGLTKWSGPEVSDAMQQMGDWIKWITTFSLPLVTLSVACLMVSRIRYPHLFNQLFRGRRSFRHLVQLIFALVAVFLVHELAIPLILFYYVLSGPLKAIAGRFPRLSGSQLASDRSEVRR
ncbi:MAG: CDP-diacylglycerol--serine O-phosphatidyltransferase [Planctomycetota bacterium]